jgi:hypothetical protein
MYNGEMGGKEEEMYNKNEGSRIEGGRLRASRQRKAFVTRRDDADFLWRVVDEALRRRGYS